MDFKRPEGLLAGYHAESPVPGVPEIEHFGEQWAPRSYRIGFHEHNTWELYLQLKGETVWDALGRGHRIAPLGLLAMPPGVLHRLHTPDSPHHFFYLAVEVSAVLADQPDILSAWRAKHILTTANGQTMLAPFQTLAREATLDLPYRAVGALSALRHLLIEASRLFSTKRPASNLFPLHPAVMRARDLMDGQPERNWSLAELAARANVSAAHLGERFREQIVVSPRQYLIQVRVDRAINRLRDSELSITQIALDFGFSSSQHLATTIRKRTGKSPSEHREPKSVRSADSGY
jgi:AraC-like DNA-binding protein